MKNPDIGNTAILVFGLSLGVAILSTMLTKTFLGWFEYFGK